MVGLVARGRRRVRGEFRDNPMTRLSLYFACIVTLCAPAMRAAATESAATRLGPQAGSAGPKTTSPGTVSVPADYVIGPEDILNVVFWAEKDLSGEVVVRPDGKISLPLIKDVAVAGLTPEQVTEVLVKAATKFVAQPNATVIVKAINSRKVFVVGQVGKPGTYPLVADTTVLQLIAQAGDVLEYAKAKNIVVVRKEGGREQRFKFNYRDVLKGKHG